ncbi:MAG: mitochondrial fission ELM1 family protein [Burkholderiales bacterium]
MSLRSAWILSNGVTGMDNQSLGLAEALGLDYTIKKIEVVAPWKYLPPGLWLDPLRFLGAGSDSLEPPWPDAVIGTGRLNVAASIAIKRASSGRTLNIRIQNPRVSLRHFDFIVAPVHDRCRGRNVIETLGAVNRVTQARLESGAQQFATAFSSLPRPLVGVLIGGTNQRYAIDERYAHRLADKLIHALDKAGGSALITPSRRTAPAVTEILRERLKSCSAMIWDGRGDNPYFAYLALADYLIVTADSVNMASEACYTGKPVYVDGLTGGRGKFEDFHRQLQLRGCTRPFAGELDQWDYPPLDETRQAAISIRQRLGIAV